MTIYRNFSLSRLFCFLFLCCKPFHLLFSFFLFLSVFLLNAATLSTSSLYFFLLLLFFPSFSLARCTLSSSSFFFVLPLSLLHALFFLSLTLSPADSLFSFQIWCVELFYGFCKLEFCELFRFFFYFTNLRVISVQIWRKKIWEEKRFSILVDLILWHGFDLISCVDLILWHGFDLISFFIFR